MGLTDDIAVLSAALASIAAFIDEQIRARVAKKNARAVRPRLTPQGLHHDHSFFRDGFAMPVHKHCWFCSTKKSLKPSSILSA